MRCLVTAGPTYEPLDAVRRLTNFSTGRLGSELGNFLTARGHEVTLLVGQPATWHGERQVHQVETFTTTADLRQRLQAWARQPIAAVFHAAAVSDFTFGKIWQRTETGELREASEGKISTREGTLLAELVPTPKIIAELRDWFSAARIVGWKYEVDGDCAGVIRRAVQQIAECHTDACVANGPAYGHGFGIVNPRGECLHAPDSAALFTTLESLI